MTNFTKRTVTSRPGLSHEAALESLQDSPFFSSGTKIASFRRRGNAWVADIRIPKQAGPFPPSDDEESGPPKEEAFSESPEEAAGDSGSEDKPSSESDSGGESKGDSSSGDGDKSKPSKGGGDSEVLGLLHQLIQGLTDAGVLPPTDPADAMGGHDDLGPDAGPDGAGGPPPAPPEGGPGAGRPPKAPANVHGPGAKLRPGEIRNTPGATPVGSPAFASSREAMLPQQPGYSPNPGNVPQPGEAQQAMQPGTCPPGQQMVGGTCQPIQTPAPGAGVVGKVASFTATTDDTISIKEAKTELEGLYSQHGYQVKQIKREGGKLHALLSVR